jgi:DNA-binding protein WhiA
VAYAKSKHTIRELLAHMGAHDAVLSLDEAEVISRTRERANRATNCDEANLARQGAAAIAQTEALAALDLEGLGPRLRQVAELRLGHPDLSLAELGRLTRPPLSKSAVAGRMRLLMAAAEATPAGGGRRSGGSS